VESLSTETYFDKNINVTGNLLIKHCTGHKPHNSEIDVPLIYADYYFIEALSRLIKLEPSTSIKIPVGKNDPFPFTPIQPKCGQYFVRL
jgi:unsaturated chondroitin disaccharide hydrolase